MRTGTQLHIWAMAAAGMGLAAAFAFSGLGAQTSRFHGAPATAAAQKNPLAGKADAAKAGGALYAENCSVCHGAQGQGTGNIPDLRRGITPSAKDGEVNWYITHGDAKNGMPAWPSLTQEQRWQVVIFLRTLPGAATAAPASAKIDPAMEAAMRAAPPPKPPYTDFRYERPGALRKITVADLPPPFETKSAGNAPHIVKRPDNAWPQAPQGFVVELYATDLD